jgi:hypothetical protein
MVEATTSSGIETQRINRPSRPVYGPAAISGYSDSDPSKMQPLPA